LTVVVLTDKVDANIDFEVRVRRGAQRIRRFHVNLEIRGHSSC
jgi:hypothetical protein